MEHSQGPSVLYCQVLLFSFVRQQQLPATQFLTMRPQNTRLPTITLLVGWCVPRVGPNHLYAPYMTVHLVISLPKILCRHRLYIYIYIYIYICMYGYGQPYMDIMHRVGHGRTQTPYTGTVHRHRTQTPYTDTVHRHRTQAPYTDTVHRHRTRTPYTDTVHRYRTQAPYTGTVHRHRTQTPYTTVYFLISLPKPYTYGVCMFYTNIHQLYMDLANVMCASLCTLCNVNLCVPLCAHCVFCNIMCASLCSLCNVNFISHHAS